MMCGTQAASLPEGGSGRGRFEYGTEGGDCGRAKGNRGRME